ncbi:hypothetical protein ZHAS_00017963 [Anopheles sinensis]|uniref:Uncharacterized protein n=1 Tax=Anopheles sinensis TaxID=74873 RepID=A0A084WI86_ANOSI|nr:hypothetical protein ZHAS_00017963 [Anopheles sinensis]
MVDADAATSLHYTRCNCFLFDSRAEYLMPPRKAPRPSQPTDKGFGREKRMFLVTELGNSRNVCHDLTPHALPKETTGTGN